MNVLSSAIENKLEINEYEAREYASIVMDLFGFDDRIIDNILEHEDRQLFYMLESEGILNTEREEVFLHDGRNWRIHYWLLKKKTILKYSNMNLEKQDYRTEKTEEIQRDNIYSYLPKHVWATRKL